jgi:cellobiose-specific phosphotransferase system component IIA
LTQAREGGNANAIDAWEAHHFTSESDQARNAIDEAGAAIETARSSGAGVGEAENTFDQAVNAYESENFDLAAELATEAQSQAESAQQSRQTLTLALYAVGGLVVVALLVGGFLYWRSQQETHDPLG